MTVPIYFVALAIAMAAGFNADRTGQKAYHVMGACAAGCISFVICASVGDFKVSPDSRTCLHLVIADALKVRYVFICFGGAGIWTAVPIYLSWVVTMYVPFDLRSLRSRTMLIFEGLKVGRSAPSRSPSLTVSVTSLPSTDRSSGPRPTPLPTRPALASPRLCSAVLPFWRSGSSGSTGTGVSWVGRRSSSNL
jgi:hypothetical protein